MQLVIFNGLGARRKLAYRNVNRSVDNTAFVLNACKGIVVIKVPDPRRKSKHRQQAARCQSLAYT
jgi:hypothetical protein